MSVFFPFLPQFFIHVTLERLPNVPLLFWNGYFFLEYDLNLTAFYGGCNQPLISQSDTEHYGPTEEASVGYLPVFCPKLKEEVEEGLQFSRRNIYMTIQHPADLREFTEIQRVLIGSVQDEPVNITYV